MTAKIHKFVSDDYSDHTGRDEGILMQSDF